MEICVNRIPVSFVDEKLRNMIYTVLVLMHPEISTINYVQNSCQGLYLHRLKRSCSICDFFHKMNKLKETGSCV